MTTPGPGFPWKKISHEYADHPYLISEAATISYQEFAATVHAAMAHLQELNISANDRVAIAAANRVDYVVLLWAIWQMNCAAVPLNIRLPAETLVEYLSQTEATLLIAEEAAQKRCRQAIAAAELDINCQPMEVLRKPSLAAVPLPGNIPLEQLSTIVFTSGSSGHPKAAVHTLGNHYYSALGANRNMPLTSESRWLPALPLFHVGGLAIIFRTFLAGSAMVFPDESLGLIGNIDKYNVSHTSMVATQLHRCLQEAKGPAVLARMSGLLLGGSAIPHTLIDRALATEIPIHTSYGSTETASQACATPVAASEAQLQTAGQPLEFREVMIDNGGQILLRGKTLFCGYWKEGRIEPARNAEGWFESGDSGFFDAGGNLVVTGRLDQMFISGGENIQPAEIERELCRLPDVAEAVVVPVNDDEFGERPLAFVRMTDDSSPNSEQLRAALRSHLPGYKIPAAILAWPIDKKPAGIKIERLYFKEIAAKWSVNR